LEKKRIALAWCCRAAASLEVGCIRAAGWRGKGAVRSEEEKR